MKSNLCHQLPTPSIAPMGITNYVSYHHLITYHQANMTQTKLNNLRIIHLIQRHGHPSGFPNTCVNTFPFSLLISHQSLLFLPSDSNFWSSFTDWSQITSPNHVPSLSLHSFRLQKIILLGRMLICYGEISPELSTPLTSLKCK